MVGTGTRGGELSTPRYWFPFTDPIITARQLSSWHHIAMPDDHHPLMPRHNPEDIDLGATKAHLEFLIERGYAVYERNKPSSR